MPGAEHPLEALEARVRELVSGPGRKKGRVVPVWSGICARAFPPAVLPDGKTVVLKRQARQGQGTVLWYEEVPGANGELYVPYALEFVS